MVIRRKRLLKELSISIDQYCEDMSEKAKKVAANLNERVFYEAQDKVICDILGYKLSCGEVKERLVSIRKAREELKNLLDDAKKLEIDLIYC